MNNSNVVRIPASQYCSVAQCRKNEGYAVVDNDHVIMATAINQVAFISTGIPNIENSLIEPRKCSEVPFANNRCRGQ